MSSSPPGARASWREQGHAVRRRAVLDAAAWIAAADGEAAVTMQRVARELGFAVGSIYRYFPSKAALLAAIREDAHEPAPIDGADR